MTILDLIWDQSNKPYDHQFSVELEKRFELVSIGIFVVNVILSIIIQTLQRRRMYQKINQINNTSNSVFDDSFQLFSLEKKKLVIALEIINIVLFWFLIMSLTSVLIGYSVFNLINIWLCGFSIFLLGIFGILIQIGRSSKFWENQSFKKRYINAALYFKYILVFQFISVIFFSIFLPIAFQKGCLCVYNRAYGLDTLFDQQFSTEWTRSRWLPDRVCPKGTLCHIYATLPEETSKEVFINVHSGSDIEELNAEVKFKEDKINLKCDKIPFPSSIEDRGQRNVFTCFLTDLKPYTLYDIDLIYQNNVLNSTKYRTIAEQNSNEDLIILFGGDWGYQTNGLKIVEQISKVDPDAILIGGDIAYDNGNIHCYYSFDLLFSAFEQQYQKVQRLIPFIFSVGNHDVGFDDYSKYNLTVSDEKGPLYFTFFPQKKSINNTVLPVKDRVTYNIQKMQNILLFGLDSGYLYPHNGIQYEWMKSILNNQSYTQLSKFAHYHVPIYPTCHFDDSFINSSINNVQARAFWVPLFDQFDFVGAFENHVHQYKRTFPLKGNKRSENGTVYFGDGSMGVLSFTCPEVSKTYLPNKPFENMFETVNTKDCDHFWVLKSYGKNHTIEFNAFQPDYTFIQNSTYKKEKKVKQDL